MISEGFNRFYIDDLGGPIFDDVECLGEIGSEWAVYYIERGQKSDPIFTSTSQEKAIEYYYNHVAKIEHWHMIVCTRSKSIMESRFVEVIQLSMLYASYKMIFLTIPKPTTGSTAFSL